MKYVQALCDSYSKPAAIVVMVEVDGDIGSVVADCVHKAGGVRVEHVAVHAVAVLFVHMADVAGALSVIVSVDANDVIVTVAVVSALVPVAVFAFAVLANAVTAIVNEFVTAGYFVSVAAVSVLPVDHEFWP